MLQICTPDRRHGLLWLALRPDTPATQAGVLVELLAGPAVRHHRLLGELSRAVAGPVPVMPVVPAELEARLARVGLLLASLAPPGSGLGAITVDNIPAVPPGAGAPGVRP